MNPLGETITGKTISSVITDEMSPITIGELQDTENQIDDNSAAVVAETDKAKHFPHINQPNESFSKNYLDNSKKMPTFALIL